MKTIHANHTPDRLSAKVFADTFTDEHIRKGVYTNLVLMDMRDAIKDLCEKNEQLKRMASRAATALIQEGVRVTLAQEVFSCVEKS